MSQKTSSSEEVDPHREAMLDALAVSTVNRYNMLVGMAGATQQEAFREILDDVLKYWEEAKQSYNQLKAAQRHGRSH